MASMQHYQELRRRMTRSVTRVLLRGARNKPQAAASVTGTEIRRVLVCRPNHRLGNLLLLTPLLQELQRVLPAADIDIVLAGDDGAGLFRTFRNVKHIYTLSRRMVRHPLETARIAFQIRRAKYDLAIDPCEGSQSSRWLMAIAHASHVIGTPGNAPGADSPQDAGGYPAPRHMAQWPVHLLRRAIAPGGAGPNDDYPPLDLQLSPAEHQRGGQILHVLTSAGTSPPRVIGIFADARGAKRYAEAWWMRFIEALHAQAPRFTIVEIAPPDGRSRLSSRFPDFFSPDIREVAAVISRMACFISADCGVMHLGSASGTPTLGLFSVTDATRYAPYGHGSRAIDTNGRSPEDIARIAATLIEAIHVRDIPPAPRPATNPPPVAGDVSIANDGQSLRPGAKD